MDRRRQRAPLPRNNISGGRESGAPLTPEAELIESVNDLAYALRENLQKPPHVATLAPLRAKLQKILRRRFLRQRIAFLRQARPWLKWLPEVITEDGGTIKQKLQASVAQQIAAGAVLDAGASDADGAAYDAIIEVAAQGAIETLGIQTGIDAAKDAGNRFAVSYLRDRGFSQLTADIDATTKERIANAVADVYADGGSYADAVRAVKGAFADAEEARAQTIAQTELADAYNQAILGSAKEIGAARKEWAPDNEACPICEANALQGVIELDEDFDSGDDAPPAHPNCDCSLSIVLPEDASE